LEEKSVGKKICLFIAVALLCASFSVSAAPMVTITVWALDPVRSDNPQAAYVKELVTSFMAKNPDIKIDWASFGDDGALLNNKLKIAMANNRGLPDIFQSWGGNLLGEFADKGRLLDLTKDLADIKCSDAARNAMSSKGKVYGIAPFFTIAGLIVNDGKFKELKLSVPTTIKELDKTAEAIKAAKIQPFALGAKDQWPVLATYMNLVNRFGGNVFDDAVARKVRFDAKPFVQAGLKIQEWAKKGYFGTKPLDEAYDDAQLAMQTGKAAMQISGSWLCGLYADKNQSDQTFTFNAVPVINGGKGLVSDQMGMTDVGFAVTKAAATKKAAVVRFLKYAMSPEVIAAETGETGRVSSVPGVKAPTYLLGQASDVFSKAKTVQFWWDQSLPSAVTSSINVTIQSFLLADTDVEKALTKIEALAEENMGKVKK
jgi:raffinose/stachyose/melibiose transport system substrate-binding protein